MTRNDDPPEEIIPPEWYVLVAAHNKLRCSAAYWKVRAQFLENLCRQNSIDPEGIPTTEELR